MGIGELAEAYGLSRRVIRYYQTRGLVSARRDRENRRNFDATARRRLRRIGILRCAGLTIETVAAANDGEVFLQAVLSKLR